MSVQAISREVTFPLHFNGEKFELYYHSDDVALQRRPEAYVAATLLPAMKHGIELAPERSLDPWFVAHLNQIQDIYTTWYPELQRIYVKHEGGSRDDSTRRMASADTGLTAAFFSGGVDSFYTLLRHLDEIDTLVFVHGINFDIDLEDYSLREQVSSVVQRVGETFGKGVIEIETNLRDFSERHVRWLQYYGGALASVALVLPSEYAKVYIAAAQTYSHLIPSGAHPLLDPLWGTSTMRFVHDGCEAQRIEKVATVAKSDAALRYLRVCWRNPDGAYNCGRCEKCIRTMLALKAVGALDRCHAFNEQLVARRIAGIKVGNAIERVFAEENLEALEDNGAGREIIWALKWALHKPRFGHSLHRTFQKVRSAVALRTRLRSVYNIVTRAFER